MRENQDAGLKRFLKLKVKIENAPHLMKTAMKRKYAILFIVIENTQHVVRARNQRQLF